MVKSEKLDSLQVCRAVAALLVLLDHFSAESSYFLDGYIFLNKFFLFGRAGVTFFFVLSGFIICYSHWHDMNGNSSQLRKYFTRRFTRIFPAYWPVLVIVSFMFIFFGGLSHNTFYTVHVDALTFIKNMFLVSYDKNLLVTVAWTLQYEIAFYLFFGLFIVSKAFARNFMFIWLGLIVAYNVGLFTWSHPVIKFALSFYVTQFMIGCLAAYITKKWSERVYLPHMVFLLGALGFLVMGYWEDLHYDKYDPMYTTSVYAACSFLIILGLAKIESIKKINCPKFLVFLGGASYALYLIHRTVLAVLYRMAQHIGFQSYPHVRYIVLSMFILGSTVLLACFYHKFYEVPAMRFTRKLLSKKNDVAVINSSPVIS